jgi:hypothetical protein
MPLDHKDLDQKEFAVTFLKQKSFRIVIYLKILISTKSTSADNSHETPSLHTISVKETNQNK